MGESRLVVFTEVDSGKKFAVLSDDIQGIEEHTEHTCRVRICSDWRSNTDRIVEVQGSIQEIVRDTNLQKIAAK